MVLTDPILYKIVQVKCGSKTGSGFLVSGGFLITAGHNLSKYREHNVKPEFFLCEPEFGQFTTKIPETYFDLEDKSKTRIFLKEKGDICIIKLIDHNKFLKDRFFEFQTGSKIYNKIKAYGFPPTQVNGFAWNSAKIDSDNTKNKYGIPQLTLSNPGEIREGFSGSPMIDYHTNNVVGMILQRGDEAVAGIPAKFIKSIIDNLMTKIISLDDLLQYEFIFQELLDSPILKEKIREIVTTIVLKNHSGNHNAFTVGQQDDSVVEVDQFSEKITEITAWWYELPKVWQTILEDVFKKKHKTTEINIDELIKAMQNGLEYLNLSNREIDSLKPLENLSWPLTTLIFDYSNVTNIDPILRYKSLNFLSCKGIKIKDSELFGKNLGELRELHTLIIDDNELYDLKFVENLPHLIRLNCNNLKIKSLTPLSILKKLKHLEIRNTQVKTLTPLYKLSQLESIDLTGAENINATEIEILRQQIPSCNIITY